MEAPGHASRDRDSNYRALVRDVVLGTVAVIFVSLAVPAWIIHAEYRKTYRAPASLVPGRGVSRNPAAGTGPAAPPAPHILEFAEGLVRREAERREAERRAAERRETERRAAVPRALRRVSPVLPEPAARTTPTRPDDLSDWEISVEVESP